MSATVEMQNHRSREPEVWLPPVTGAYLEHVHGPLLLTDLRGAITFCNGAARRFLGFREDQAGAEISLRTLLKHARASGSQSLRTLLAAIRAGAETTLLFDMAERSVPVEVVPFPDGWAVRILQPGSGEGDTARVIEAQTDSLTGLPNRISLQKHLLDSLALLERTGQRCAVLMIDLDRFKQVNDSLGHAVGDALLKTVAARVRSALRPSDIIARVGGDEFVVVQNGPKGFEDVQALASRLVDLVGRAYVVEGHLVSIGASVGIALAPQNGTAAAKLLKNADLALYRAKAEGRGTFQFFEPEMDARMQARRLLELELRKALVLKQFELHYQPQLNLETNRLVGCEALVRWRHPSRGLVSPADFIPLSEEIGLIVPLGEWVIRTACKEAARWPGDISIAVNLSPAQFKSKRLVDTIVAALTSSGLAAHRLELEITEGVLLQENETTLQTLHRLRDLGVRISMDDFGTGYSSLSYLRSFPFDKIKIDRSFVADLASRPDGYAIIRAIAGLGTSLGMTTVAEGVETVEQMHRIRLEGCTDAQGYLISRPVPAGEVLNILSRRQDAA